MRHLAALSALALVLCLAPAPAAAWPEGDMDRLVRAFRQGTQINIQITFDPADPDHDRSMNTRVDTVRRRTRPDGDYLSVMTDDFTHEGVDHYFYFVFRGGELIAFDLMMKVGETWVSVPSEVFYFDLGGAQGRIETDSQGRVTLSRRGLCNKGRGVPVRGDATLTLRSYHVEGAGPLDY